jgi:hypothetical protein
MGKERGFVRQPLGEKGVAELPGVGPVAGEKLSEQGFDKAYVVLGQFLMLKKEKDLFMDWMKEVAGSNKRNAESTYDGLTDWCCQHG